LFLKTEKMLLKKTCATRFMIEIAPIVTDANIAPAIKTANKPTAPLEDKVR
jgi:hypothetical protein